MRSLRIVVKYLVTHTQLSFVLFQYGSCLHWQIVKTQMSNRFTFLVDYAIWMHFGSRKISLRHSDPIIISNGMQFGSLSGK